MPNERKMQKVQHGAAEVAARGGAPSARGVGYGCAPSRGGTRARDTARHKDMRPKLSRGSNGDLSVAILNGYGCRTYACMPLLRPHLPARPPQKTPQSCNPQTRHTRARLLRFAGAVVQDAGGNDKSLGWWPLAERSRESRGATLLARAEVRQDAASVACEDKPVAVDSVHAAAILLRGLASHWGPMSAKSWAAPGVSLGLSVGLPVQHQHSTSGVPMHHRSGICAVPMQDQRSKANKLEPTQDKSNADSVPV